jgi:hypothetical protein
MVTPFCYGGVFVVAEAEEILKQQADLDNEVIEEDEHPGFLIPWLIAFLRWIEELITAISGYAISFALAIGVMDILSNGQFVAQFGWVDLTYAGAMAAGIVGQLVASSARASRSFSRGEPVKGVGYLVLVFLLAFTEYQAGILFGYHQAFGISVVDSLGALGLGQAGFIQFRTGVAVFLAVLSGFLRYQPAKAKSIAQMRKEAYRKQSIADMKTDLRVAGVNNAKKLFSEIQSTQGQTQSPLV